ncbi:MAG: hypothetical protein LBM04_12375 [Opitutaceae bacterium]|jgi:hypothetical protein|nr:hypothetical protein [Opitutaceae bacterium]
MDTNDNNDRRLRTLLREHVTADARATPGFRAAVWRRIDARRGAAASWPAWLRAHVLGIAACTTACVTFAVISAGILANSQSRREREALIQRYITSIDPMRKTPGAGHHHHPEDHR